MNKIFYSPYLLLLFGSIINAQNLAVLKYEGGGDWYSNPTALKNLIEFCNTEINTKMNVVPTVVAAEDVEIFEYPMLHMTGHGNVFFSDTAIQNLKTYLIGGGFLHIDDNYGMKPYLIPQLKKLFPEKILTEIPLDHPIYNLHFKFPNGLPKIHQHDGLPPKALGIFHQNTLVLLYTFETDLGDGWEDQEVHNNPKALRQKALEMGANIVKYAFEKTL